MTTQDINVLLNDYGNNLLNFNNLKQTYTYYKNDNAEMAKSNTISNSEILTNYRKTYYEQQGIINLKFYYTILIWLYIAVCVAVVISLFTSNLRLSTAVKIVVIIFLIIYPFVSIYIYDFLMKLWNTILNIFPENTYKTL
jgi:lipopolysaccharide export LptBFGC system permease protein LptF